MHKHLYYKECLEKRKQTIIYLVKQTHYLTLNAAGQLSLHIPCIVLEIQHSPYFQHIFLTVSVAHKTSSIEKPSKVFKLCLCNLHTALYAA